MAKTQKQKIGDLGEGIACNYLRGKGFEIIERNYWKPWGEIDIVAEKQGITYFIEVKTVSLENFVKDTEIVARETTLSKKFNVTCETIPDSSKEEAPRGKTVETSKNNVIRETYRPEEKLHPWKLKRLGRAVQTYILSHNIEDKWEFSAIIVYLDTKNKTAKINHIKDIVL